MAKRMIEISKGDFVKRSHILRVQDVTGHPVQTAMERDKGFNTMVVLKGGARPLATRSVQDIIYDMNSRAL